MANAYPGLKFTTSADMLISQSVDVLIDASSDASSAKILAKALRSEIAVVSASRSLKANEIADLTSVARAHDTHFKYAACVGGSAPILETIEALEADRPIGKVEAILCGLTNFIGSRLLEGASLDEAICDAQTADIVSEDLDGALSGKRVLTSAHLIAWSAFPDWVDHHVLGLQSISGGALAEHFATRGKLKQIAKITPLKDGRVGVQVKMENSNCAKALLRLPNDYCAAVITFEDGETHFIKGRGGADTATAISLFGDLGEIERKLTLAGRRDRKGALLTCQHTRNPTR